MRRTRGFSLIELITALAVITILAGLGLPAFRYVADRVRADATFHELTASLMSARMLAIASAQPVTVCPSDDGRRCRDDRAWENGWIIFRDPARTGEPASDTAIVRRFDPLPSGYRLETSVGRIRIRFLPNGSAAGTNATFRLCGAAPGAALLGSVILGNSGRARTERARGKAPCTAGLSSS